MDIMKNYFLEKYTHWIHRPGSDKLLQWLEATDFFTALASTRFHLAEEGGLAEHSVHAYDRLQALYQWEYTNGAIPTRDQNESIAICGLLHDVCKVNVYQMEPKNRKTYDPAKVAAAELWQGKHDAQGDFV